MRGEQKCCSILTASLSPSSKMLQIAARLILCVRSSAPWLSLPLTSTGFHSFQKTFRGPFVAVWLSITEPSDSVSSRRTTRSLTWTKRMNGWIKGQIWGDINGWQFEETSQSESQYKHKNLWSVIKPGGTLAQWGGFTNVTLLLVKLFLGIAAKSWRRYEAEDSLFHASSGNRHLNILKRRFGQSFPKLSLRTNLLFKMELIDPGVWQYAELKSPRTRPLIWRDGSRITSCARHLRWPSLVPLRTTCPITPQLIMQLIMAYTAFNPALLLIYRSATKPTAWWTRRRLKVRPCILTSSSFLTFIRWPRRI